MGTTQLAENVTFEALTQSDYPTVAYSIRKLFPSLMEWVISRSRDPLDRSAKCARNFARSQGRNGGVLRTDSLVDVAFLFTLKAVQYIPAQNIDVAALGDLVP
jgi:hypothetical protein